TLNSAFTLGSIGINTFLAHSKFYNHFQMLAKVGRQGFCQMKSEQDFDEVFAISPSSDDSLFVLRNLQTLVCKTNKKFLYHLSPISKCFETSFNQTHSLANDLRRLQHWLEPVLSVNHQRHQKNEVD